MTSSDHYYRTVLDRTPSPVASRSPRDADPRGTRDGRDKRRGTDGSALDVLYFTYSRAWRARGLEARAARKRALRKRGSLAEVPVRWRSRGCAATCRCAASCCAAQCAAPPRLPPLTMACEHTRAEPDHPMKDGPTTEWSTARLGGDPPTSQADDWRGATQSARSERERECTGVCPPGCGAAPTVRRKNAKIGDGRRGPSPPCRCCGAVPRPVQRRSAPVPRYSARGALASARPAQPDGSKRGEGQGRDEGEAQPIDRVLRMRPLRVPRARAVAPKAERAGVLQKSRSARSQCALKGYELWVPAAEAPPPSLPPARISRRKRRVNHRTEYSTPL